MSIYDYLTPRFCETYNLEEDKEFEIEHINPNSLFCSKRLDLVVKYKYVDAYLNKKDMTFIKKVYKAHIEAFSQGLYIEPGQENEKKSIYDYYRAFNELIENISKNGFDEKKSAVPIGKDNIICNGSHRVAIAMYLGCTVPCIRLQGIKNIADYRYFQKRLMPEKYIDYMALGYCAMRKNIYAGIIWPKGNKILSESRRIQRRVRRELSAIGNIVLTKELKVSFNECNEMVKEIYYPASWLGKKEEGCPGAKGKTEAVYDEQKIIKFFLIECTSLEKIITVKKIIRDYMDIGNHSIHISDNYNETIHIIKMIFGIYNYFTTAELERNLLRFQRNINIKKRKGEEILGKILNAQP